MAPPPIFCPMCNKPTKKLLRCGECAKCCDENHIDLINAAIDVNVFRLERRGLE